MDHIKLLEDLISSNSDIYLVTSFVSQYLIEFLWERNRIRTHLRINSIRKRFPGIPLNELSHKEFAFQVEEENVHEEPVEVTEEPFVEEPEGAESKPQTGPMATGEDGAQIEEVTSGEEFDWGDQDAS